MKYDDQQHSSNEVSLAAMQQKGCSIRQKSKCYVSNIMNTPPIQTMSPSIIILIILGHQQCNSTAPAMSSYVKATRKTPTIISYMSVLQIQNKQVINIRKCDDQQHSSNEVSLAAM